MTQAELENIDKSNVWHPFTQSTVWKNQPSTIIEKGENFELIDTQGNRYLDGTSSLWCNVHGHSCEPIIQAIKKQADKLCHSTFLGLTHEPGITLTSEILSICPKSLSHVFYSESGTTAVEAAIRMAIESNHHLGQVKRNKIASLKYSYHGDTLGSVSVGHMETFHAALGKFPFPTLRVKPPHVYNFYEGLSPSRALAKALEDLHSFFENEGKYLICFIVEPMVQGAAGMWIQPPQYLAELADLCKRFDVVLIVDEVATGFGKTGKMFAFEHAEITPDILVLGKGLSGGYLPIAATVATDKIFNAFSGSQTDLKTFSFGTTYCGNPLTCSAAIANLRLFRERNILASSNIRIEEFAKLLAKYVEPLRNVYQVRRLGVMTAIELTSSPGEFVPYKPESLVGTRISEVAKKNGVIIRPLGNCIIIMPAITMGSADLSKLVMQTAAAIEEVLDESWWKRLSNSIVKIFSPAKKANTRVGLPGPELFMD